MNSSQSPRGGRNRRSRGPSSRPWKKDPAVATNGRKGMGVQYGNLNLTPKDHYSIAQPDGAQGKLRVAVMGGNEEVGKNMTMLEYGDDVILIDMGIQFGEEHMRGIDGIVPDLSYIKENKKNVRAVIITHMHMDHIGGIPFLMPELPGVPVFSAPITLSLIAKKLEYTPDIKVDLHPVDEHTKLELGNFKVSFIGVSHSVPSALAVVIETPAGKIVHTGDFKVDLNPTEEEAKRYLEQMKGLGEQDVLALLSDSTNATQAGNQLMERDVMHDLETIVQNAKGRLLFGMISTNVVRLGQIIKLAEKHGRSVAVGGRSLKVTLEIAENLGYITPLPNTLIEVEDIQGMQPNKVLAIFPGAQGESNAAFFKLANDELKDLKVMPGDTVVFSSSVIPGNERSVQFITDQFYRRGAKVINYRALNIHAGGHAKAADLGEVIKMIKPKYLIPIEGHHAFLHHHAQAAQDVGFSREHIFIADNGQLIEFDAEGHGHLTKQKVSTRAIFVDGSTVAEIDENTLRERKRIGDEGMLIVRAKVVNGSMQDVRVMSYGFRRKETLGRTHAKIVNSLKREYAKMGKGPGALRKLEIQLGKIIERETGNSPFILLDLQAVDGSVEHKPKPQHPQQSKPVQQPKEAVKKEQPKPEAPKQEFSKPISPKLEALKARAQMPKPNFPTPPSIPSMKK